MNRSFLLLLATVSIALVAIVYSDRKKISDLEKLVASMRTGTTELQTERDRVGEENRRLSADVETFKAESNQLREQLAARPAPGVVSSEGKPAASPAAAGKGDWMKGMAKMFTDPEMKKTMRVQQLVGIRMLYGDLAKELGLAGDESEQLLEILADRQMDLAAATMSGSAGEKDGMPDAKKLTETQARYTEQLKAVLNGNRYEQFQKYERSIGDRFLLQQSEGQFAASGAPLEPAQKQQLLNLMSEERAKKPSAMMNSANPREQMDILKSDKAVTEFASTQEDFNRRVLERSRDILNADQLATLEKVQQQQLEMMKAQVKMSREFLGIGK